MSEQQSRTATTTADQTSGPDDSEPTPERQAELRAELQANANAGRAPYTDVHLRSRGELLWIAQERQWRAYPGTIEEDANQSTSGRGHVDCADLRGVYLANVNLSGASLKGCDLSSANLLHTNFSGADLFGTNLIGSGQTENDGRTLSSSLFDHYPLDVSFGGGLKCHLRSLRIRVNSYLDPERSNWLDGWAIIYTTVGETLLSGPIVDQAVLQDVLLKIRDLRLPLLEVKCSTSAHDGGLVNSEGESGTKQE